jgi:hypothetical protein
MEWPRTRGSGGWRRTRRREATRDGDLAGAALDHAAGRQNVHKRVLHKAGVLANTTVQKGWRFRRPRRLAPEGGGADLAGVRASVLRCTCKTKDGGMRLLTTRRQSESVHRRGRSDGDEDQRRRRARAALREEGRARLGPAARGGFLAQGRHG